MISLRLPLTVVLTLLAACSPPPGRPAPEPAEQPDATTGDEQEAPAAGADADTETEYDESPEAQAVVAAWDGYKRALRERDGEAAADLVTPATVDLYDRWRLLALHASAESLREHDAPARLSALLFRQQVAPERLAAIDGRQLFATAVAGGWVGSDIPAEIRVVRIDGDTAFVHLVQNGQALPVELPLVKRVDGAWKVDIGRLVQITEPQIAAVVAQLAQQRGEDEDAALLYIVQSTTGQEASDDLWTPPQPEESGADDAADADEDDAGHAGDDAAEEGSR